MANTTIVALLAVALLTCVAAAQQIPITEQLLKEKRIILDIIDGVALDGKLNFNIDYPSGPVNAGNFLSINASASQPTVKISCKPGACTVSRRTLYTLITADPDAPSPESPSLRSYWHWGVVNAPNGKITQGDAITPYQGPAPPKGIHRYIFLLFRQQGPISAPQTPLTSRPNFNVTDFAAKHNLGQPVAVNWFTSAPNSGV